MRLDDMQRAEKYLKEEKARLGIYLLFSCRVVGYSADHGAYEVNFTQGDIILRKEFIPRPWLDDRGPNKDPSSLHILLREVEQLAKQRKQESKGGEPA